MPHNIYYLDDEPDLLEMFVDLYSSDEICITIFSDPNEALAAVKKNPPDMIFLDYRLPNTTGDAVAQKIDPKIPKILITGDDSVKCETKFITTFQKPYRVESIRDFITLFFSQTKAV